MKELVMATNNVHKLEEVRQILGSAFTVKGLSDIGCMEDIPETADTIEGNALQKARYVHEHYGVDCFADDTGLEVDALNGAPGVYTARFGAMNGYGESHDADANIRCLLDKLEGAETRGPLPHRHRPCARRQGDALRRHRGRHDTTAARRE